MSHHWKLRLLLLVAVVAITGAVLTITTLDHAREDGISRQLMAGEQMLSALVKAHASVHSYGDDRDVDHLIAFNSARHEYGESRRDAFAADEDAERRTSLARQAAISDAYFRLGHTTLERISAGGLDDVPAGANHRLVELLDRLEAENAVYDGLIRHDRSESLRRARLLAAALVISLSLVFAVIGQVLLTRSDRQGRSRRNRERAQREGQREFGEVLQVTESESEAYDLIKRHLERSLPEAAVTVMSRNNSRDRLEARTQIPEGSQLAERLLDAEPRSCVAIRLAREHTRSADEQPLLECEVCGEFKRSTCVPSLVGGEVIGSVLVAHEQPLSDDQQEQILSAVGQASPALGNLRNLALAESRALTDALTGLPNTRAGYDTLKRMVAQASRTGSPLSALMLDLDHFKQINDSLGHEKGDQALAAIGDALGSSARESDFVGRYGGDEFLMLLPNTYKAGALEVAEKLRLAVSLLHVPGTDRTLTASCGVATFPDDAQNPESVLRLADRALYAAKAAGRNRVSEAILADTDGELPPVDVAVSA